MAERVEGEESAPHPAAVSLILDADEPGEEREKEKMIRKTQTEQRQKQTTKQES